MPLQGLISRPALAKVDKLAEAGHAGAKELATYYVGQAVGLMNTEQSARAVVYEFMKDYAEAVERLRGHPRRLEAFSPPPSPPIDSTPAIPAACRQQERPRKAGDEETSFDRDGPREPCGPDVRAQPARAGGLRRAAVGDRLRAARRGAGTDGFRCLMADRQGFGPQSAPVAILSGDSPERALFFYGALRAGVRVVSADVADLDHVFDTTGPALVFAQELPDLWCCARSRPGPWCTDHHGRWQTRSRLCRTRRLFDRRCGRRAAPAHHGRHAR